MTAYETITLSTIPSDTDICIPGKVVHPISARETSSNQAAAEKYNCVTAERSHKGIDIKPSRKNLRTTNTGSRQSILPRKAPQACAIQDLTNTNFYIFSDATSDEYLVVNRIGENEDNRKRNNGCYVRIAGQQARPASAREVLKSMTAQTSSRKE